MAAEAEAAREARAKVRKPQNEAKKMTNFSNILISAGYCCGRWTKSSSSFEGCLRDYFREFRRHAAQISPGRHWCSHLSSCKLLTSTVLQRDLTSQTVTQNNIFLDQQPSAVAKYYQNIIALSWYYHNNVPIQNINILQRKLQFKQKYFCMNGARNYYLVVATLETLICSCFRRSTLSALKRTTP